MLEKYGFYLLPAGALLAVIAFLWLVVRAMKVRRLWGFAVLCFPPNHRPTSSAHAMENYRKCIAILPEES